MRAKPIPRRVGAVLLVTLAVVGGATAARVLARPVTTVESAPDSPPVAAPDASPVVAPGELDAELAAQFEAARQAAAADGITLEIVSGLRTAAEQQVLVDEAVATYGEEEAHRRVMPAESSAHVLGSAIDVGPTDGVYWLIEHGSAFGLCQVYLNEVWHFELLTEPGGTCPAMLPDAASAWG